jgi:flagellar biosynthesis protein
MSEPRKPLRQAVALCYEPAQDDAPHVAAKGRGPIAERILALARAHAIPIREDKNLVQLLSALDLNKEIPPAVYKAVAEILAWVYKLTQRQI